jgi:Tol biopolymer transport system component
MSKGLVTAAFIALALSSACGDPTGPHPGLNILSGGGLSDTVGTTFRPPLTVQLLDGNLQPVSGQTVYFGTGGPVLVAPISDPGFVIDRLPVITDANGQAAVWVECKFSAGPAVVIVTANSQSARTNFTVLPGAPAHVRADPSDTALYVGGSVTYRPFITDAYGDRRSDTPAYQYQTLNPALTISSPGKAAGAAIGRGSVAVTALGFTDTVWASVVPEGRVAAQYEGFGDNQIGYIVVTDLDGSAFDTIPGSFNVNHSLDWSPLGPSLVVYRNAPDYLVSIDMATGSSQRVVTDSLIRADAYPSYAKDGSYIYFTGVDSVTNCYGVWRIHPAGTGLEHVVADTSDCGTYVYSVDPAPDYASSLSPDGTRIVYAGRTLHVRTLATGADTSLGVVGDAPRWSPAGDWIAYDSLGTLMLIHPDGTGHQALFDRGAYGYLPGVAWSPDGQWLIYRNYDRLALVNVASGLRLPLSTTLGLAEPTWQP